MWRHGIVGLILLIGAGCAADGQKGQWDEFWKDVRGENMEMRHTFPDSPSPSSNAPASTSRN